MNTTLDEPRKVEGATPALVATGDVRLVPHEPRQCCDQRERDEPEIHSPRPSTLSSMYMYTVYAYIWLAGLGVDRLFWPLSIHTITVVSAGLRVDGLWLIGLRACVDVGFAKIRSASSRALI